jgi:Pathogenicity locus
MSPNKVNREKLSKLTDLPNVGKACVEDFHVLGIYVPEDLIGKCPFELHALLCKKTGVRHDPCVIDVFMSVTRFLGGEPALSWWHYTAERKQRRASVQ